MEGRTPHDGRDARARALSYALARYREKRRATARVFISSRQGEAVMDIPGRS